MDRDGDPPFSSGLYLANLAVSSNLLQDSWDAISELEPRNNQHFLLRWVKRVFPQLEPPATFRSYGNNPNYKIIAFVTSPVTTCRLQEERELVSSSEIPDFQFLCSKNNQTFHINKAAISLFNSLQDELSQLKEKIVDSANSKDSVPYIITGRCLGGSIASLFTLWILNTLDPVNRTLPFCITFGSPLLGDNGFQQSVSQYSTWNSCFLHVVHKDDCFPRLLLHPPTTNPSQYKPFGTFLLCSESGGACFEAPESIMKLLTLEIVVGNRESQSFDYKNAIGCLEQRLIHDDCSRLNGQEADSYKAGVTTQVIWVGLESIQEQNEGRDALIEDIVKHERGVITRQREAFDPAKKLDEMKVYLAFLEWYMKICKANGQGPGYYDSFKNARERRDNGVDKYKTILTDYWERVVTEADKKPRVGDKPLRNRWHFAGTNYRRIVEPLDIAEYYKRGRKDYLNRGRSEHYKLLQKWLEDHQKEKSEEQAGPSNSKLKNIESSVTEDLEDHPKEKSKEQAGPSNSKLKNIESSVTEDLEDHPKEKSKEQAGPSNSKLKNIESSVTEDSEDHPKEKSKEQAAPSNSKLKNIESIVTEDSCFWAHVEEAIRLCRLLESGGSSNSSERAKLIEFEKYVWGLIKEYKVSPDIFLEKSSYMQWWREYVEILKRPMMGDSQNSLLVAFMGDEPYKNYAEGSPRMFEDGHSNVNPPDSSNASLWSTEGREISPSSFSLQFSLRFLSLSLVLLLSLCLCLFLFLSYFSR